MRCHRLAVCAHRSYAHRYRPFSTQPNPTVQPSNDNVSASKPSSPSAKPVQIGCTASFNQKGKSEKQDKPEKEKEKDSTPPQESLNSNALDPTLQPGNAAPLAQKNLFDTYNVYLGLKNEGKFTSAQSDLLMQALASMLARALARTGEQCVATATSENEAYLFEAACSELRNEIQMSRKSQSEQFRSDLARLQRDVDILQHGEVDESVNTLKVELDMEINERKNSTRVDENTVQLQIQELNNKIAIHINSDVKSEIERLRWQTTRRGLTAVIFVAVMLLVAVTVTRREEALKAKARRRPRHPPPKVADVDEYTVPVLTTSEMEDTMLVDLPIERL